MGNCLPRARRKEMTPAEKESRGQDKESNEGLSTSNQEDGSGSGSGSEVCYTVLRPGARHRPSASSNDNGYENIDAATKRVKSFTGGPETEYALLRTPGAPRPASCTAEQDYELVLPH